MEIKDMNNAQLQRYRICTERQIKNLQSTLKQIKDEEEKRFDNGTLIDPKEEII